MLSILLLSFCQVKIVLVIKCNDLWDFENCRPFMNHRSDQGCDYKGMIHSNMTSRTSKNYKIEKVMPADPQNITRGYNNACIWPFTAYVPTFY